jgi:putative RNA 2'-phosphotransferase
MTNHLISTSTFLSLVLRHQPETIGVTLDSEGWIAIAELLAACAAHGKPITRELLEEVVATNDKRRFSISPDGVRIRANQGHSVDVDLGLTPQEPPDLLFHGTVAKFLDSIRRSGLIKGTRHHVHMSADEQTAGKVGQRRGQPVILIIEAARMSRAEHAFFQSDNGVWLVDAVPAEYLRFPSA